MSEFPALDDFDDFSTPTGGAGGGSADFLARERELLGDEFGPTPTDIPSTGDFDEKPRTSFPSLDGDDDDTDFKTSNNAASRPSNDFMSSFERDQPAAAAAAAPQTSSISAKVEDDDDEDDHDDAMLHADINKFQTQYPDLQVYPAVDQQQNSQYQNGYSDAPSQPVQQSYPSTPAPAEPESEAIRAWREKQAEEIAKRDEDSARRKSEIISKAEKSIDDFYSNYNSKKEKQIAQNKEDEAAFVQARDDALAKGTTWERIADLIELQDSRSKTVARGTKDLSRMKEVLLSLKREGDTAPNAAGY